MLSRTSHYALRALVYLARHEEEWPIPGARMAQAADIPRKYLSKVLGDLVRSGVLESTPGRTGGFRLCHPPDRTMLIDVLAPFEHFERRDCPFGNQICSDSNPCGTHYEWKKVLTARQDFLRNTSLRDIAIETEGKRRVRSRTR
jgi:Rrf2 family protein